MDKVIDINEFGIAIIDSEGFKYYPTRYAINCGLLSATLNKK